MVISIFKLYNIAFEIKYLSNFYIRIVYFYSGRKRQRKPHCWSVLLDNISSNRTYLCDHDYLSIHYISEWIFWNVRLYRLDVNQ